MSAASNYPKLYGPIDYENEYYRSDRSFFKKYNSRKYTIRSSFCNMNIANENIIRTPILNNEFSNDVSELIECISNRYSEYKDFWVLVSRLTNDCYLVTPIGMGRDLFKTFTLVQLGFRYADVSSDAGIANILALFQNRTI